ncbi:MAG TPA: phenylalanine--tRNA ligase subunit beta [Methylomirabilota bacterium]|nr:phenylalanine--tRNA ligase subunit beta [Methylomirabilota bacterium]
MKVSYRWLREFVETDLPPAVVADRLVNAGIEVAALQPLVEGLSGVVIGEIEAIEQDLGVTPAGHHNRLCRVALPDKRFSVVCGAPNAAPGLRSAFAPPGATLPGGRTIKATKIRGTLSEGMLCSEEELGIGMDGSGILELPADAPLGAPLDRYLGLEDTIFDIEITPNRPDALSVVGVAREVAAITGAPFRFPQIAVTEGESDAAGMASVEILDPDLCPRYAARVITGLTVKPSPPWLAQRLRAVGLRPINNLVDVTNYVLWEMGHPLHAFDYDSIVRHRIIVRRAQPGEHIVTLDGQDRTLAPDMLLICDPDGPIAVGGVMGGASTEVTVRTTNVLLESAYFNPGSVRATSRTLGLHTDAAYRFERGADIEGLREALDRATQLMADLGGGTVAKGVVDVYPGPKPRPRLALRRARVERVIGVCPPHEEMVRILQALGFAVDDSGLALQIVVPSFRRDITQEDDLVEEIVRVWGYDKVPSALAGGGVREPVSQPPALSLTRAITRALTSAGVSQAITYALVDPARLKAMGWDTPEKFIALQNPISSERSVLRPSLAPGLLEIVALNGTHQIPDVRAFEIGHTFAPHREGDGDHPAHEELWLAVAMTGQRAPRAWHATRERVDVHDVKGAAELALHAAGFREVETTLYAPGDGPRYLEQGRGAALAVGSRVVGWFGEVALGVRETFDLSAPVFLAELSLTTLLALPWPEIHYQPLPRFPAVQRDLAVVVPDEVTAGQIEAAIRSLELPLLSRLTLFDVYEGGQMGTGKRSLAWSLTFQAPDRTLTDREVNELHARIVSEISRRFAAEVRGVS